MINYYVDKLHKREMELRTHQSNQISQIRNKRIPKDFLGALSSKEFLDKSKGLELFAFSKKF
jgi:hypothetical protein